MTRLGVLLVFCAFAIAAFTQKIKSKSTSYAVMDSTTAYTIPDNVKGIINKSCYDCHNGESKNLKAKTKLRLDKMHEYDQKKLISKLDEIIEVIDEEKMPPKKFLEKFPEATPSEADYNLLKEWAKNEADALLK